MLILLSTIFFGYGLYQILYKVFRLPDETMLRLEKRFQNNQKKSLISIFEEKIYFQVLRYIKFDDLKKRKLKKVFLLANINETPEQYYAEGVAATITKLTIYLGFLFFDFVLVLNGFTYIVIGLVVYEFKKFINYIKKPYKDIEKNKLEIEEQMYPLVINIEQELSIDTDVIRILDNFKNRTSGILKKHLEITLSEARVSNIIDALVKMESRINSTMVSDVVRGLIALSRGENNKEYFSMLSSSFKSIYINQKRKEASLLPGKISKYIGILVLALIVLVIGGMIPLVFNNSYL